MPMSNRICAVIPTYNNCGTLEDIVRRTMRYVRDVVVVNDGSTDASAEILSSMTEDGLHVIQYGRNRGKGYALRRGLLFAAEHGFSYALTIDSDGQHYPEDIPLLLEASGKWPEDLITGQRTLEAGTVPGGRRFANGFSNFWYAVQTGTRVGDTQCGFRLYPLWRMRGIRMLTSRYESELELLVFSAWAGIKVRPVPVRVWYPPAEERISHFRPFYDFLRISVLNTLLCGGAVLYGYPMMLIRWICGR